MATGQFLESAVWLPAQFAHFVGSCCGCMQTRVLRSPAHRRHFSFMLQKLALCLAFIALLYLGPSSIVFNFYFRAILGVKEVLQSSKN